MTGINCLDNVAMGKRIRYGRERLGLTRGKLAEQVGLSEYYLGQLERGERQMSLQVLVSIASCLHLSLDYIVTGNKQYVPSVQEEYRFYNDAKREIINLLEGCTESEITLFIDMIKLILPHLKR